MGPVIPSGCAHQVLLGTVVVLEAVTRGASPEETRASEEVEEGSPLAQAEQGPSVLWACEVQSP